MPCGCQKIVRKKPVLIKFADRDYGGQMVAGNRAPSLLSLLPLPSVCAAVWRAVATFSGIFLPFFCDKKKKNVKDLCRIRHHLSLHPHHAIHGKDACICAGSSDIRG